MKKIYLAGPMVFMRNADQVFEAMKAILAEFGLQGIAPADNQVDLKGTEQGPMLNRAIFEADVEIMRSVDGAIFNLNPFRRGTEMDAGTAFEVGYCRCLNVPMSGWTTEQSLYPALVARYFRETHSSDLVQSDDVGTGAQSGQFRDPDGMLVHSEGLYQNLMVQIAIEESGGQVHVDADWITAFRQSAADLADKFKPHLKSVRLAKA